MSEVPVILLPESLRNTLGEAASRDLVEVLNAVAGFSQDRVLERMGQGFAELRAEVTRAVTELRAEVTRAVTELRAEMHHTVTQLRAEIAQTRSELQAEIDTKVSRAEARLIKWAFAFWATGVTALVVAILLK